jgi:hypothetical protein
MKKIFFIATSLLVLAANAANACSCLRTTPQESFKNSSTVFAGKVIDIVEQKPVDEQSSRNPDDSSFAEGFKVIFEVSKVWKGQSNRQLVVMTSGNSASCGYSFQKGQEYLVYASNQGTQLQTGLCSGTQPLSSARTDLAVLGRGKTPTPTIRRSNTEQLQQSKRLWANKKMANYRYTLQVGCHCLPEVTQPVVIEVRNGKTRSIVAANSGKAVNPEYFQKYNSVAKLFDVAQDAIAKKPYRFSVTYHPTLGYPTKINIDYDNRIADEELFLTIDKLEIIK